MRDLNREEEQSQETEESLRLSLAETPEEQPEGQGAVQLAAGLNPKRARLIGGDVGEDREYPDTAWSTQSWPGFCVLKS